MLHALKTTFHAPIPTQETCDVSSGSVRMVWVCPCGVEIAGDSQDQDLLMLCREEAIQRQFLRTSEQYLKGENQNMPVLGAWRRKRG